MWEARVSEVMYRKSAERATDPGTKQRYLKIAEDASRRHRRIEREITSRSIERETNRVEKSRSPLERQTEREGVPPSPQVTADHPEGNCASPRAETPPPGI